MAGRRASQQIRTPALSRYVAKGFFRVQGWAGGLESIAYIDALCQALPALKGLGGACEIGVHHGKLFIALHNALEGAYPSLALDIFEDQHLNLDGSGKGNRKRFEANVRAYAVHPDRCHARKADSLALAKSDLEELRNAYGRFALFSVDGGHTARHAANDLRVADELTADGGIVMVDDIFSIKWPGATAGTADYLRAPSRRFHPLLLSDKKLFLVDDRFVEGYEAAFKSIADSTVRGFSSKPVDYFGFPCLAIFSDLR